MGIDIEIAFRKKGASEKDVKQVMKDLKTPYPGINDKGYTYDDELDAWRLFSLCRYYGPYYTRGPWKDIYHDINHLINSGFSVMYFGDCDVPEEFVETDINELKRINEMWEEVGEIPYMDGLVVDYKKWGFN